MRRQRQHQGREEALIKSEVTPPSLPGLEPSELASALTPLSPSSPGRQLSCSEKV